MSKWTLQKILDCEEIKFKATFSYNGHERQTVLTKTKYGIKFWDEKIDNLNGFSHCESVWKDFTFYRPGGTEILPPKEMVVKKFYLFVKSDGQATKYFHSEDLETYWYLGKEMRTSANKTEWTRTNCFIEKKVEA